MFKMILFIISVFSLSAYSNYQILPYGGGESVSKSFKKALVLELPPPDHPNQPRVRFDIKHGCVAGQIRHLSGMDLSNTKEAEVTTIITAKKDSSLYKFRMKYNYQTSITRNVEAGNYHRGIGCHRGIGGTGCSASGTKPFSLEKCTANCNGNSPTWSVFPAHELISKNATYYQRKADHKNSFDLLLKSGDLFNILNDSQSTVDIEVFQNGSKFPTSVDKDISRSQPSRVSLVLNTASNSFGCGGWISPLMLFFSDKRPSFLNISNFPLFRNKKTSWVEKDHVGYFLAIDLDQDGKISEKEELFGNDLKHLNGFESLRRFDSNKDGLISHKDERFKDLLLWNDKNGDGIGLKRELSPLHKKVKEISLNYTGENTVQTENALASGRSHFITKKGKKAEIIDYWFKPAK